MAKKKGTVPAAVAEPSGWERKPRLIGRLNQPVTYWKWVDRNDLVANDYNPNHVAPIELELLAISLLEDGWTQPIVCLRPRADGKVEIVDGFHRWTVSGWPSVWAMTEGQVPVVFLERDQADRAERMMATIRHNRARGTHGVKPMAAIVAALVGEHGIDPADVGRLLGMEAEEVRRLSEHGGMPTEGAARVEGKFSGGWVPTAEPEAVEARKKDVRKRAGKLRKRAGLDE